MKLYTFLTGLLASATLVLSQGAPNTVAAEYYDLRTQVATGIWFLIAVNSTDAESLVGGYSLLQVPGFATGTHPCLVWSAYGNDIRMGPLYIDTLLASQVIIPFLDRLNDGQTPFSKTVVGFIGGTNGNTFGGIVPATVGTIASGGGYPLYTAIFDPDTEAYEAIAGNQFYTNTKLDVIPNPLSGPGVTPAALDFLFASGSGYSVDLVNGALNQPAILPTGQCQRNNYRFNETFADIVTRSGTVELYSPAVPSALTGGGLTTEQTYAASGFSGTAEVVGFNPEDCATAAVNVIVV